jgi:RHS repeat-associated protein
MRAQLARHARRVRQALLVATVAASAHAFAQYCPVGSTFFSTNYLQQCTVGSCWSNSPFQGSTSISGSYPGTNYACASSTPPTGATESTLYTYDGNGNLASIADPLSHTTTNTFDALDRLVGVLDPASGITSYGFNGDGALTQVTDPRSLVTGYTVDGFGETSAIASPDTGSTSMTYDADGNVLTRIDARGVTATYTYDPLNRIKQITYSKTGTADEVHSFEYDGGVGGAPNAKGRLTKVSDPAAITTYTYEPHGRVLSKAQTIGSQTSIVTYGYNTAGQLVSVTTPSGQQIGYSYTNNRVSGVTVNGAALINSTITEPFGPLSLWQWANNHYSYRDYDADGRVSTWEFRNGVSVIRNDLMFDAAGRVTQLSDPANATLQAAYQYDALDRLITVQKGNPVASTVQYAYDGVGNRQSVQTDSATVTSTYGASSNQLQSIAGAVDGSYMLGAPSVSFAYNNANRLTQIQAGSTTVATYLVNALGQRVQKTASGATTQFVYDESGHLIGEYDGTGALIQETVWMEDLPIATLRPTGTGNPTPIAIYYVHPDHLGSPRAVTRPSDNAIVWRWDNTDAFGNNPPNENPSGLGIFTYNLRFPGQYFDAEIATNYNYFRDYDPGTGRYVESDPIGLKGGINTYAYVAANPLVLIDPLGLCAPGARMKKCLEKVFNEPIDNISVTIDEPFVHWHFGDDENGKPIRGATTRPGKIFINFPCDQFWAAPDLVLHEYYHVVQQWGHDGMSIPGYLLTYRKKEKDAWDFAKRNLEKFKNCLSCDHSQ